MLERIKSLSQEYSNEVVKMRRHLHANPELSYHEYNTVGYVAGMLRAFGIEPTEGIATTGLIAEIKGRNPGKKTVALRADMDALPIAETNEVPYRSKNPGVMHACGHDVHTSSLLGTARILNAIKDEFEGTVRLLFQPGEEKNPGGASYMIRDGALENPRPAAIIGQHVFPLLEVGKIGFREGMYMASADEIYLKVIGKGGHGAWPDLAIDPVVIASHIIIGLQQIISRNASPRQPTVLTFGKISGDGATNIIPDEVNIAGTFRAMNETWRNEALEKIRKMAEGIAVSMGGRCEVNISRGYPYLENDPALTQRLRKAAEAYVGPANVVDLDITLGAEDFAYYSQVIPASFYRLGTRNEAKGITSYVHTPAFDIDEDALTIGPGLMAWMAVNELTINE
jgi:amidohydrolase